MARHSPKENHFDAIKPIFLGTDSSEGKSPEMGKRESGKIFTTGAGSDPGVNNYRKSLNVETDSGEKEGEITPDVGTDPAGTAETGKRAENAEVKQKFKLEFMVDPEFLKKVEKIRSELSRKYPSGVSLEILFNIVVV